METLVLELIGQGELSFEEIKNRAVLPIGDEEHYPVKNALKNLFDEGIVELLEDGSPPEKRKFRRTGRSEHSQASHY